MTTTIINSTSVASKTSFTQFQLEVMEEAIRDLSNPHYRKFDEEGHCFFKRSELEYVLSKLPNHDYFTISVILDEFGDTYCYELKPVIFKETRTRNR